MTPLTEFSSVSECSADDYSGVSELVEWNGVEWSGVEWSGVEWSRVESRVDSWEIVTGQ
jgi:hypothetical protein